MKGICKKRKLYCTLGLCRELYAKMRSQELYPKTIADYTREPFVLLPAT